MSLQLIVHRPRGVLPRLRRRTVVEYQPSWLLLALPALVVLRRVRSQSSSPASPGPDARPPGSSSETPGSSAPAQLRRRRRPAVGLVAIARLRRRTAPGGAPGEEVIVVTPVSG